VNWLDLLQWPAAILTLVGAWFVGSKRAGRRRLGFWLYLSSNVAWVAWGVPASAYAVVALQVFLAALNVRGMVKADPDVRSPGS
jgi:hypothetical protein